jgi:hypothetical protein
MPLLGTWYNELGSTLVINEVANGVLSGQYSTAVSSGGCAQGDYEVQGTTDGQTVGMAVTWANAQAPPCNSTTTWAGQYEDVGGQEILTAMWLLVMNTTPEDNWSSTLVGQDVFTRSAPAEGTLAQASVAKRHAHP